MLRAKRTGLMLRAWDFGACLCICVQAMRKSKAIEDMLLAKFVLVLNTKKQRIRELEQELRVSATRGQGYSLLRL